jgi:thymidylate kinase
LAFSGEAFEVEVNLKTGKDVICTICVVSFMTCQSIWIQLTVHLLLVQAQTPITLADLRILLELPSEVILDEICERNQSKPWSASDRVCSAGNVRELKQALDAGGEAAREVIDKTPAIPCTVSYARS